MEATRSAECTQFQYGRGHTRRGFLSRLSFRGRFLSVGSFKFRDRGERVAFQAIYIVQSKAQGGTGDDIKWPAAVANFSRPIVVPGEFSHRVRGRLAISEV